MNAMIRNIVKKDIRANSQDIKIQILTFTVLCLTLAVSVLGVFEYRTRYEQYSKEVAVEKKKFLENTVYATIAPRIIQAPSPLAVLCKGVEPDLGNSLKFDITDIPFQAKRIYESNPYTKGFLNLDLATVFIWIFSLISILISYDLVSKEREDGTLKLMFVGSLSREEFFLAKIASSLLSLGIILMAAILIVTAVFLFTPWISFGWQEVLSVTLFFLYTFLYGAFWIAVGAFCSVRMKSSSQSLVIALSVWICLLIVVPALAKAMTGNTNFAKEKQETFLTQRNIHETFIRQRDQVYNRYVLPLSRRLEAATYGGSPGSEPIQGATPKTMEASFSYYREVNPLKPETAERKSAAAHKLYLTPFKKKIALNEKLSCLSPETLFQRISMQLAETSYDRYFAFLDNFGIYHRQIIDHYKRLGVMYDRIWFTAEGEYYPFSPGHPLCPSDPDHPTPEERKRLVNYYFGGTFKPQPLDLSDFPVYTDFVKTNPYRGYGTAVCISLLCTGVVLGLGFYRIRRYLVAG